MTIDGQPFEHLIYHFVLTYSNWERGTICFAGELREPERRLAKRLWELGGVPQRHRTDGLTAAVPPGSDRVGLQPRYQALLQHYGLQGQAIKAGKANENGDAEQSHRQFKRALDQALMLRGSRDFASRADYEIVLAAEVRAANAIRQQRLAEEVAAAAAVPARRLETCKRREVRVDKGSTIHVEGNTYSVASRLIGEKVEARLYAEQVEVWYAQQCVERLPRLRGRGKHRIEYRHVIDWLVRKPGAFADYRYREELFPSSRFRLVYDPGRSSSRSGRPRSTWGSCTWRRGGARAGLRRCWQRLLDAGQPLNVPTVEAELASAVTMAVSNGGDGGERWT